MDTLGVLRQTIQVDDKLPISGKLIIAGGIVGVVAAFSGGWLFAFHILGLGMLGRGSCADWSAQ